MTLAGLWQNEYGSQMDLGLFSDNLVMGTYSSSTGSTGKYMVIGYQASADPTASAGQPVALAIEWHSIAGGQGDPSWHWSSGLSGQISIENGQDSLVLAHAMVASSDFPGLCSAGTYIDKLTYTRVSGNTGGEAAKPDLSSALDDPLAGTWQSSDGSILFALQIYPYTDSLFGWIEGRMSMNGNVSTVYGVTDINATSGGLSLQSAAITGLPGSAGPAIAFAGCLDLAGGLLTLLDLTSQSTAPNATYVQTTASQLTFTRIGGLEKFEGA